MATRPLIQGCLVALGLATGLGCSPAHASGTVPADETSLDIGGAVRFNLGWLEYADPPNEGELELELLRFDAKGRRGPFSASTPCTTPGRHSRQPTDTC